MVTAIVIPLIIVYFYVLSKKERKKYEESWKDLEKVNEEAVIKGRIISKNEEKQRYYYHKFVHVTELKIKTSTGIIKAKRIIPLRGEYKPAQINLGDEISCIGEWTKDHFQFNKYQILVNNK
ncbi:hypothetical protein [Ferdinandcohnia sp. SAFN-114]|uniref:hypothetical protein n=1 Tax=Ferdinandcohnia sp. SAFN-114 TaxID=3387275 RepID=UPI003F8088E5